MGADHDPKGLRYIADNTCVLPCVAAFLLLALLLMRSGPGDTSGDDKATITLDISQHPGWPEMERALEVTMLKKMEDVGITSILHGASVEDMSRHLYLVSRLNQPIDLHVYLVPRTVIGLHASPSQ